MTWQDNEPTSHARHPSVPASERHVSMAPPEQAPSKSSNDISQAHSQSSSDSSQPPRPSDDDSEGRAPFPFHRVTITRSQLMNREISRRHL